MTPRTIQTRIHFTPERLRKVVCPLGKQQHILWDDNPNNLGVRITANNHKSYIFEYRLHGRNGRHTIGSTKSWDIKQARTEAKRLQVLVDSGISPKQEKLERAGQDARKRHEDTRNNLIFNVAWVEYIEANKARWGKRHLKDHLNAMQQPGLSRKRSKHQTKAGALFYFADKRLSELSPELIESWLKKENQSRPTVAALAFRLLRGFLNWVSEQPLYDGLANPGKLLTRQVRLIVPKVKAKKDCLQKEMLKDWFAAVNSLRSPTVTAYLEALLLTGARKEEMEYLQWDRVDFKWLSMTIGDKIEASRTIPLTPYLARKLSALPRFNQYVFGSKISESGIITNAYDQHLLALKNAGLPHITLHGLRRSFGTLSEWVECPVGIVAQIDGHKPSATIEKHYRQRPLDLLRMWHTKIEHWILLNAGLEQPTVNTNQNAIHLVK